MTGEKRGHSFSWAFFAFLMGAEHSKYNQSYGGGESFLQD